jgi:hypothetical protein
MIALASITADPAGHVVIRSELADSMMGSELRRRVTRVSTLDGGSAFSYGGFAISDSTLALAWEPVDPATEALVARLFSLYDQVLVAMRDGVYLVALQTYTPGTQRSVLTALVVAKASA